MFNTYKNALLIEIIITSKWRLRVLCALTINNGLVIGYCCWGGMFLVRINWTVFIKRISIRGLLWINLVSKVNFVYNLVELINANFKIYSQNINAKIYIQAIHYSNTNSYYSTVQLISISKIFCNLIANCLYIKVF